MVNEQRQYKYKRLYCVQLSSRVLWRSAAGLCWCRWAAVGTDSPKRECCQCMYKYLRHRIVLQINTSKFEIPQYLANCIHRITVFFLLFFFFFFFFFKSHFECCSKSMPPTIRPNESYHQHQQPHAPLVAPRQRPLRRRRRRRRLVRYCFGGDPFEGRSRRPMFSIWLQ
jgi:hypothetical protein